MRWSLERVITNLPELVSATHDEPQAIVDGGSIVAIVVSPEEFAALASITQRL